MAFQCLAFTNISNNVEFCTLADYSTINPGGVYTGNRKFLSTCQYKLHGEAAAETHGSRELARQILISGMANAARLAKCGTWGVVSRVCSSSGTVKMWNAILIFNKWSLSLFI